MVELYQDEINVINNEKDLEIQVPITSIENSDGTFFILEARVKVAGKIWTIHKNDKDTFPSQPHAHNYENGEKLDLHTGDIYVGKI